MVNTKVIAALHLPPFPGSRHPDARPLPAIVDYALRNTATAVRAGVPALYLQDLGDHPVPTSLQAYTVAGLAVVGAALRREFPQLVLGVQVLTHNAEGPLAIAQAIGAQFVRLKVYIGAMVKAEGILEGLAYAAIQYRARLGADEVRILADVYDRTGEPLARASLTEEATQAVTFGRADGLVLTGKTFDESQRMLTEVRAAGLGVPLYLGGGATVNNVGQALALCDGVIVSTAFKTKQGWTRESLASDWDEGKIRDFMRAAGQAGAA